MIVRVIERRIGVEVKHGQHFHPVAGRYQFVVFAHAANALRLIAREENRDRVHVRTGEFADPDFGTQPRVAPLPDPGGWTDGESARSDSRSDAFDPAEPQMPEPPPRPVRPSFADEVRRPAPALSERRSASDQYEYTR